MKLSVYKILKRTRVEGPGIRFCIWVQGCNRRCKGCWAVETWDYSKGKMYSVNEIFKMIEAEKNIEGVTFLGGEPFEQAEALASLAKKIKKLQLTILTFSGYTYQELIALKDNNVDNLLKCTDLLIDGAFEIENFDISRPWVGSSNQGYHFLTDRYSIDDVKNIKNKLEVRVAGSGAVFINGMGDFHSLEKKLCLHNLHNEL